MLRYLLFFVVIVFSVVGGSAQPRFPYTTGEIYQSLGELQTLGSALYIAAHPDDENTRLITYLANEQKVETAYFSITRGDGGQNLVGTHIGKDLGIIRTQELLAARRIDGGQQFFSRANDFGYSKTAEETFTIWDREKVLADLVWVIRKFRPDVMITRFAPPEYNYPTHGHHTASAILAEEAFSLAADPDAFPEQLTYVSLWQPRRLYWNTSTWFFRRTEKEFNPDDYLAIEVGGYNPALGKSYGEIAGRSRSQHKSQGFGAAESVGSITEYFELVAGDGVEKHFFEDIDLTWTRVPGGQPVKQLLKEAYDTFDPNDPTGILPLLLQAYREMEQLPEGHYVNKKKADLARLIAGINGLYLEAITPDYAYVRGDSVPVTLQVVNRMGEPVTLQQVRWPLASTVTMPEQKLPANQPVEVEGKFLLPPGFPYSQPYYLRQPMDGIGMYRVGNQEVRGMPELPSPLQVAVQLEIKGQPFTFEVPLQYKWVDRVEGQRVRDVEVAPKLTMQMDEPVYIFNNSRPGEINITVTHWDDEAKGVLVPAIPEGWSITPASIEVSAAPKGTSQTYTFSITPGDGVKEGQFTARMAIDGDTLARSRKEINYSHIPIQTYFPPATVKLVNVNVQTRGDVVGYIMGAGDKVPQFLEQIGYNVQLLNGSNFSGTDLSKFDAILVGIRAYNTEEWLPGKHKALMEYIKNGGRLIVQYQTTWGLLTEDIGPYPFTIGRDRVTVEGAPLHAIHPDEPVLNTPNRITNADFEGWVQERGLYFAEEWDAQYRPVFRAKDPGEKPKEGMLLIADYGKGAFIYTGISFFRELPAGVPGAFRLLANLISYGSK